MWSFLLTYFYCLFLRHKASLSRVLHLRTSPLARWWLEPVGRDVRSAPVYLGSEAHTLPLSGTGAGTPHPLWGQRTLLLGIIPVLERGCSAWTTWLCLWDQLLKAKISPKCILKPKPHENVFCVFFLYDTHGICYENCPQCFKASFEWETSSWMLHLILITRITLSASQSILLSYGWWFLTAAHDFLQNLSWKAKVSFKVWLHGLVLWIRKPSQDWLADETVVKFMAVSHMLTENSDKNKQCFFFALGSSSLVCRFSANMIPSSQKQICGKQRPEIGDGNYG